jgi:hypothetical protein
MFMLCEFEYNQAFSDIWTHNARRNLDLNICNGNDFYKFYLLPVHKEYFRKSALYSLPLSWSTLGDVKFQCIRTTFQISILSDLRVCMVESLD